LSTGQKKLRNFFFASKNGGNFEINFCLISRFENELEATGVQTLMYHYSLVKLFSFFFCFSGKKVAKKQNINFPALFKNVEK
jgi:hypothetical protein